MPKIPSKRISLDTLTPWQAHLNKWEGGCGTRHCRKAQHIVLAKGCIPCDILFIGEAPGESENRIGNPFVGPAGHQLDEWIKRSIPLTLKLAFTNVVACMPRNADGKIEPEEDHVQACRPRLEQFIKEVARPKAIVCVGKIPKDYLEQGYSWSIKVDRAIPRCNLVHPSFILRKEETRQQMMAMEQVHALLDFIEQVFPEHQE